MKKEMSMNPKLVLRRLPGLRRLYRFLTGTTNSQDHFDLPNLSNEELLSVMRHESHRIEKAIYNNIFEAKKAIYDEKRERLKAIYQILEKRGFPNSEPTSLWSRQIEDAYSALDREFIQKNSRRPIAFDQTAASSFVEFVRARRSVRVWADNQLDHRILLEIAHTMIDAARWAPTSGNRQPWRFMVLKDAEDKQLLRGLKEEHCIKAPLLIFVGMDVRVYKGFRESESSIFIDAGAAIMQMVLAAHNSGLGVTWNHFAPDLIASRAANKKTYSNFAKRLNVPEYITPVALVAVGLPKFIPPEPARMKTDSLMIRL